MCIRDSGSGSYIKLIDGAVQKYFRTAPSLPINQFYIRTATAVSYTHLDVYKRQDSRYVLIHSHNTTTTHISRVAYVALHVGLEIQIISI